LNADYISILDEIRHLGVLYSKQGKLAEAERMHIQVLEGREKALGAPHLFNSEHYPLLGHTLQRSGQVGRSRENVCASPERT
jgi:hypothetical protein